MTYKEKFLKLSALNKKMRHHNLSPRETRQRERLRRIIGRKIGTIRDDYCRYCLYLRYMKGMMWDDIGDTMGHTTSDAVRKMCERRIKRMK